MGTADDLKDPSGAIPLEFPPEIERALKDLTKARYPDPAEQAELRGIAYLALGDYAMGFRQFKVGRDGGSSDEATRMRVIHDAAMAIRAYDGHVHRANQYLLCHRCGGTGPAEGAQGLTDSLPEICKELGLWIMRTFFGT